MPGIPICIPLSCLLLDSANQRFLTLLSFYLLYPNSPQPWLMALPHYWENKPLARCLFFPGPPYWLMLLFSDPCLLTREEVPIPIKKSYLICTQISCLLVLKAWHLPLLIHPCVIGSLSLADKHANFNDSIEVTPCHRLDTSQHTYGELLTTKEMMLGDGTFEK